MKKWMISLIALTALFFSTSVFAAQSYTETKRTNNVGGSYYSGSNIQSSSITEADFRVVGDSTQNAGHWSCDLYRDNDNTLLQSVEGKLSELPIGLRYLDVEYSSNLEQDNGSTATKIIWYLKTDYTYTVKCSLSGMFAVAINSSVTTEEDGDCANSTTTGAGAHRWEFVIDMDISH
jgi:hypothetical protein